MRHIERNLVEDGIRARNFEGRTVDTTDGRSGLVVNAYVYKGIIKLYVMDDDGKFFVTDNEHATIRRNHA